MPQFAGPVTTGGPSYPGMWDQYLGGGFRVVASVVARNAINAGLRSIGMEVYCVAENMKYRLLGGITNAHWVAVPCAAHVSTVAPEGLYPGAAVGELYARVASVGDGGVLHRLYVFNGIVGQTTGWV